MASSVLLSARRKNFKKMDVTKDPIVDEVRRIREEQASEHRFQVKAILAAAKKRQSKSGFKVVSVGPKQKLKV